MKEKNQSAPLAQSEVREVLQYVPIFAGRTFVVALDGKALSDTILAEVLLDLITLQKISVRLIIAYSGQAKSELLDWAAEVELKLSEATADTCSSVLKRGQAALVTRAGDLALDEELVALATSNHADKILYLGKPEEYPSEWKGALNLSDACALATDSIGSSATQAVAQGVSRVHLLNGSMLGCLSRELFSNEGVGIMIYGDSYQEIRPLSEEDIPELLAIIGRSIRSQHLLPRSYEEVENQLGDYFVMTIDGNVVGSVAVHSYGSKICELACLFVKEMHKGLGYGHDLVQFAEAYATQSGHSQIFALSTDAGGFFEQRMGYQQTSLNEIPVERQAKLRASKRDSIVLIKPLS